VRSERRSGAWHRHETRPIDSLRCAQRHMKARFVGGSCGNPAVVGSKSRRPEALRPRLSTGLPISTRVLPVLGNFYRCIPATSNRKPAAPFENGPFDRCITVGLQRTAEGSAPAGNPAILRARANRTGGFASPSFDGFACSEASRHQQFRLCNCRYSTTSR
jgi:hypothetical protein